MRNLALTTLLLSTTVCFSTTHAADTTAETPTLENVESRINCGDYEAVLNTNYFKRLDYSIGRLRARSDELIKASNELVRLNEEWIGAIVGCVQENANSCASLTSLPRQIYQEETSIHSMLSVQHQLRMQIFGAPSRIAVRACAEQRPGSQQK